MSKTISLVVFVLVSTCLFVNVFPQDVATTVDPKAKFSLGLDVGMPSWFPDDVLDSFDTGRAFRLSAMYGDKLSAGLSFDYSVLDQQEGTLTAETGPEPLGSFTPQVKNQFYAFMLRYKPLSTGVGVAPFAGVRMGMLKREFDADLEQFNTFTDDNRFAYAIDFGVEVSLHPRVGLALSSTYFRTSKTNPMTDFAGSFDIAGNYGAINIGAIYRP
jgi:opacity protein-like surface antigen